MKWFLLSRLKTTKNVCIRHCLYNNYIGGSQTFAWEASPQVRFPHEQAESWYQLVDTGTYSSTFCQCHLCLRTRNCNLIPLKLFLCMLLTSSKLHAQSSILLVICNGILYSYFRNPDAMHWSIKSWLGALLCVLIMQRHAAVAQVDISTK